MSKLSFEWQGFKFCLQVRLADLVALLLMLS